MNTRGTAHCSCEPEIYFQQCNAKMSLTGINFYLLVSVDSYKKEKKFHAAFYMGRVILVIGFLLFSCAVLYVISKRMGLLMLQRKVTAALKAGMAGQADIGLRPNRNGLNLPLGRDNAVHRVDLPLEQPMHDEL